MSQITGQFVVKTSIKMAICENCKRLRVTMHCKPHICVGQKGRRVGGSRVIVLAKYKTTVPVAAVE